MTDAGEMSERERCSSPGSSTSSMSPRRASEVSSQPWLVRAVLVDDGFQKGLKFVPRKLLMKLKACAQELKPATAQGSDECGEVAHNPTGMRPVARQMRQWRRSPNPISSATLNGIGVGSTGRSEIKQFQRVGKGPGSESRATCEVDRDLGSRLRPRSATKQRDRRWFQTRDSRDPQTQRSGARVAARY
jgi:hypothetical protein